MLPLIYEVQKLRFDDERKIHGVYTKLGELVPFVEIIDPMLSKGQIESWC